MIQKVLLEIFERDLNKLRIETNLYEDENKLWITDKNIKNSGGNLCLHIIGNLNQFIGGVLGNSGYVRNRDAEFTDKGFPKKELLKMIDETQTVVANTIESLSEDDLEKIYPVEVFNGQMTTGFFLVHLTTHLNYHLGQINYHRRIIGC